MQSKHDPSALVLRNSPLPNTRNTKYLSPLKKYRIGIVGATGAVGQEIIRLLEKGNFPLQKLDLLASARSAGREIQACGNLEIVQETTADSFKGLDIAIFSAFRKTPFNLPRWPVAKVAWSSTIVPLFAWMPTCL